MEIGFSLDPKTLQPEDLGRLTRRLDYLCPGFWRPKFTFLRAATRGSRGLDYYEWREWDSRLGSAWPLRGTRDKSHDCFKLSYVLLFYLFFSCFQWGFGWSHCFWIGLPIRITWLACVGVQACRMLGLNSNPSLRISARGLGDLLKRLPSDSDGATVLECWGNFLISFNGS